MAALRRPSAPFSESFIIALALLLAALHAVLAVTATTGESLTNDEIAHLTAGRAYNTLNDYRLQPENGNLPQRWAALPMTVIQPHFPPLDESGRHGEVWVFGHRFFYLSGNPADFMVLCGRAMISLFSAGTGLLIFFWSRKLFGLRGAFLSLGLFAFCPNFLAHGALATSDVTMVFFLLASVSAWWWALETNLPWPRTLLSAAVFALACVAKFSAPLLVPMLLLLAALRLVWPPSGTTRGRLASRIALATLAHIVLAWAVIWAFYGFRYSAFNPALPAGDFNRPWAWMLANIGGYGTVIGWMRSLHLLPEAFLYGFTFVLEFAGQRGAFLSGEYSIHGWAWFFPFAFLVKTPLPLLLLLGTGLLAWLFRVARAGRERWPQLRTLLLRTAPLLVLFFLCWAVFLRSHLNIGHRHILPTYPVLFILLGALGAWLDLRRPFALALVALLGLWHAGESLWIRPHYLAYFNQLVGGPANGYRHLVDSSLDWGQDLPGLATWLRENNRAPKNEPVYLSYFGTGDPSYEGIVATRLPTLPLIPPPRPWYWLKPGIYCVSVTMLQHVYSSVRGPWTLELEAEYQRLRALNPIFHEYASDPAKRTQYQHDVKPEQWHTAWERYDQLRFARLCHYLRAREPDANIGYSIFIYRLSDAELKAATEDSLAAWSAAIERGLQGGR
ncbi:MAG: glycosyltransferase family 39 protein [Verrucomicrobia bacterium]|nr:glycosyltransferase family 39 protein [Verrucomicrobiota bacterium]